MNSGGRVAGVVPATPSSFSQDGMTMKQKKKKTLLVTSTYIFVCVALGGLLGLGVLVVHYSAPVLPALLSFLILLSFLTHVPVSSYDTLYLPLLSFSSLLAGKTTKQEIAAVKIVSHENGDDVDESEADDDSAAGRNSRVGYTTPNGKQPQRRSHSRTRSPSPPDRAQLCYANQMIQTQLETISQLEMKLTQLEQLKAKWQTSTEKNIFKELHRMVEPNKKKTNENASNGSGNDAEDNSYLGYGDDDDDDDGTVQFDEQEKQELLVVLHALAQANQTIVELTKQSQKKELLVQKVNKEREGAKMTIEQQNDAIQTLQSELETKASELRTMLNTNITNRRSSFTGSTSGSAFNTSSHRVSWDKGQTTKSSNAIVPTSGLNGYSNKPRAQLYPRCTVLFADISGFTAWSSLRDPAQVFILLESVYQAFDRIARQRGVFKVESIGDSYVAVTGLPKPQDDHALIMTLFALDCRRCLKEVTNELEVTLGPDTGDLRMRFGLHSGPVTAGVLRGDKRFQLFGDTVSVAAKMENTGDRDCIQVSQATADLLKDTHGKEHWLVKRPEPVMAKGKGEITTYWIDIKTRPLSGDDSSNNAPGTGGNARMGRRVSISSVDSALWGREPDSEIPVARQIARKKQRLIDYNVDMLAQHLKRVIAKRRTMAIRGRRASSQGEAPPDWDYYCDNKVAKSVPMDECCEIIKLPTFNPNEFKDYIDPREIELNPVVMLQLENYVTAIADLYRDNPFHNFEHASHVTMSVNKLLQRVVTPDVSFKRRCSWPPSSNDLHKQIASEMHNYTYGITSDPLTQFAIVFSALIHDVDHWGVSNMQLAKEKVAIAEKYDNKSTLEQNSIDVAWNILMNREEFGALHQCIFPTDSEVKRFRQVVVNVVMGTDIFDPVQGDLRKKRWEKAFSKENTDEVVDDIQNRKATIVIEHIMQASDVAHTMQHWHVYQKWNRRLFDELYTAWRAGRMGVDPSTFWFAGELKFFDGYIIPLARKLKDCGVFGVSSDECLNYALDNRAEWEVKGKAIVEQLVESYMRREKDEEGNTSAVELRRRSLLATGSC